MNELMDENNSDEKIIIDNSRLEEIMEIDPSEMTEKDQKELLKLLKKSQLYIPIEVNIEESDVENVMIEDIVEPKLKTPSGFNFI